MTEMDDKLLKQFFSEHKQEIADNGFSRRVIKNLPDRSLKISRIWTTCCCAVALILFFALDGLQAIGSVLRETFTSMVEYGAANLDIRSLMIAGTVLLFLGVRKIIATD
ncbi:DUF5056 domain-containing protein [Bacteroides sp. 51]|uniref:DUF5056 domain-containing protein n=1 Tax=Bacteroides sp. 51 TaxID=2302938 RepID=UPI0013D20EF9|nr:DUF5056 domain-containing protein [Bacteroides sp. 51]NDV82432.1 DUF5056 domain-containing protein [Bacteroides sp. 51]